jgi:hypothetical protein
MPSGDGAPYEKCSVQPIWIEDPDSIYSILLYRIDQTACLFRLDGRPHLAGIRVAVTVVAAYAALLSAGDVLLTQFPSPITLNC